MTVQESMGGLVNFCLWKSSDRHHPRLGILESKGTRGLRDQLVREIRLFHDVLTNVVDPLDDKSYKPS